MDDQSVEGTCWNLWKILHLLQGLRTRPLQLSNHIKTELKVQMNSLSPSRVRTNIASCWRHEDRSKSGRRNWKTNFVGDAMQFQGFRCMKCSNELRHLNLKRSTATTKYLRVQNKILAHVKDQIPQSSSCCIKGVPPSPTWVEAHTLGLHLIISSPPQSETFWWKLRNYTSALSMIASKATVHTAHLKRLDLDLQLECRDTYIIWNVI